MPAHASPSATTRYGMAVLATGMMCLLAAGMHRVLQSQQLGQISVPLLFVAVVFSAWHGGIGPGIVAALLSPVFLDLFLAPPYMARGKSAQDQSRAI